MRIVVTGATGNVGTSVVRALAGDERVTEIDPSTSRGRARASRPASTPATRRPPSARSTSSRGGCESSACALGWSSSARRGPRSGACSPARPRSPARLAPGGCGSRKRRCARSPQPPGARICNPRRRAGSTSGSTCRWWTRAAREELGWTPRRDAVASLRELLAGMREPAGADTPPLRPRAGGPLRVRELLTGLGRRLW